jgi:hypothetical protein
LLKTKWIAKKQSTNHPEMPAFCDARSRTGTLKMRRKM